jgi:hypothetical protein
LRKSGEIDQRSSGMKPLLGGNRKKGRMEAALFIFGRRAYEPMYWAWT